MAVWSSMVDQAPIPLIIAQEKLPPTAIAEKLGFGLIQVNVKPASWFRFSAASGTIELRILRFYFLMAHE